MIYVLYGNDFDALNSFIDKLSKEKSIDNIITYDYEESTIDDIITECIYTSLFSDNKIVIVNNTSFLTGKSSIESDLLDKYIDNPIDSTILIFKVNDTKLDERKKIVKTLKEKYKVLSFNLPSSKELNSYISNYFKNKGYTIDNISINEIASRINDNTVVLLSELNKLITYKEEDKTIKLEDVKNIVTTYESQDLIFKLSDYAFNKDAKNTFIIYHKLIDEGNEPIAIIALLANQIRLILNTKILLSDGLKEEEIASKLKEHPYRVKLSVNLSRKLSKEELFNLLNLLYILDLKIKTGAIDKNKGLETFLLNLLA